MERGETAHFNTDDAEGAEAIGRFLGLFARRPRQLLSWPAYAIYRAATERRWLPAFVAAWARGAPCSISPFAVVMHDFMSRDEFDTEEGKARLDSCAFRVPVRGQMVSMCELNATSMREELNREQRLITLTRRA